MERGAKGQPELVWREARFASAWIGQKVWLTLRGDGSYWGLALAALRWFVFGLIAGAIFIFFSDPQFRPIRAAANYALFGTADADAESLHFYRVMFVSEGSQHRLEDAGVVNNCASMPMVSEADYFRFLSFTKDEAQASAFLGGLNAAFYRLDNNLRYDRELTEAQLQVAYFPQPFFKSGKRTRASLCQGSAKTDKYLAPLDRRLAGTPSCVPSPTGEGRVPFSFCAPAGSTCEPARNVVSFAPAGRLEGATCHLPAGYEQALDCSRGFWGQRLWKATMGTRCSGYYETAAGVSKPGLDGWGRVVFGRGAS